MNDRHLKHLWIATLLWSLTCIWFGIGFLLSSQNGTETGALSTTLAQFLIRLFGLPQALLHEVNSLLRTMAHILVFSVLTFLAGCACGTTFKHHRTAPWWPILPCILFAILDEVRKAAIPGRHCSYAEAGLNVVGCLCGCAAAYWLCYAFRHRASRKRENSAD